MAGDRRLRLAALSALVVVASVACIGRPLVDCGEYTRTTGGQLKPYCDEIVQIARRDVGIRPGAVIRVVDPLPPEVMAQVTEIALVVATAPGDTQLIVVGYRGIDTTGGRGPGAWVADRAFHQAAYEKYVDPGP